LIPINGSAVDTTNIVDLGSSATRFKDLYLAGGASITGDVTADNITSTSNSGDASIYINSTRPTLGFTDTNSFSDANDIYIIRGTGGNKLQFQFYDDSAGTYSETFNIDSSGNATFAGDVVASGNTRAIKITNAASTPATAIQLLSDSSGDGQLRVNDSTGSTKIFFYGEANNNNYINNGGNLGVGTNSPNEKLHVYGGHLEVQNAGNTNIYINAQGNSDATLFFQEANSAKAKVQFDSSNDSLLLTDGEYNDTMTLKGQKVGIGTTSPDQKFHVEFANTDTSFSGGSGGAWGSDGIRIENTSNTAGTMAMLHLRNKDAFRFRIFL